MDYSWFNLAYTTQYGVQFQKYSDVIAAPMYTFRRKGVNRSNFNLVDVYSRLNLRGNGGLREENGVYIMTLLLSPKSTIIITAQSNYIIFNDYITCITYVFTNTTIHKLCLFSLDELYKHNLCCMYFDEKNSLLVCLKVNENNDIPRYTHVLYAQTGQIIDEYPV